MPHKPVRRTLSGLSHPSTEHDGLHDISEPEAWYVNNRGSRTCLECKRENDRRAEAKRSRRARR